MMRQPPDWRPDVEGYAWREDERGFFTRVWDAMTAAVDCAWQAWQREAMLVPYQGPHLED